MRFVSFIVLLFGCIVCASFDAAAQEGQKGGESAEAANEAESAEAAARERLRRLRMGNVAKLEIEGKTIAVSYGNTPTDGPDYAQLETIEDGSVVQLTKSIVTKLKTELDLKFGDITIKTENVAKNYPGVYGLWLKRADDGWHLVFNEYADVWGTQHFSEADVAEIPLTYAKADETVEKLTITVLKADGGGTLQIAWGEYQWSAAFTVAG